ncbi:MAG: hypothetical protein H6728_10700 [Myxococcales bacterium]|nr:hypothetical protein [Myxococcales bacterium]MCB9643528.1 hypothetical protein [Myxococcales bacterium]
MSRNEESKIPTPFSKHSWEPRFAVDAKKDQEEILEMCLRLHLKCSSSGWAYKEGEPVFFACALSPSKLAVSALFFDKEWFPPSGAMVVFEAMTFQEALTQILAWLKQAPVPETPWFDGGEKVGFQAYHVAWDQHQLGPANYMIVEPKWFEIHK